MHNKRARTIKRVQKIPKYIFPAETVKHQDESLARRRAASAGEMPEIRIA